MRIVLSDEAEREEAQSLIRDVSVPATLQTSDDLDYWEHKIESGLESDVSINPTDREAIIRARTIQKLDSRMGSQTRSALNLVMPRLDSNN